MRLLAALVLAAHLPAATVTGLDGSERTVDLTPAAFATLPLADLDRIVLGSADLPKAATGVWLADGSWLPSDALRAEGSDRLRIIGPLGDVVVPLAAVRGWGPTEPPPGTQDRLVLGGGPVEGQVAGLSAEGILSIRTALDPEPIRVPLAEVAAAALRVPALAPVRPALLAALADDRPPVRLVPGPTGLTLAVGGSTVAVPAVELVVDGPRRTWLSSLNPAEVRDEGAFGVVWPWQRDTDLRGGPLRLGGRRFASGVSVHSAATLSWDLAGGYLRLRSQVGIADLVGTEGDADVSVLVDGQERWHERRLRGGEHPRVLDLDLTGARRLTLVVALGERHDIGDHVTLAGAYLVRR